ncbi:hypothetical protein [Xenorhabdus littoralis]|uniref:hypothetical protein n=1 Tax=Xenorhabdus littoralis TaxID=2582835 RepID=UPI0029E7EEE3|nr:hypothetical protein [Xenorhabdus sp. psl]MDX7991897.1 hypothetical protein [Xenorhabdus sp. psl]
MVFFSHSFEKREKKKTLITLILLFISILLFAMAFLVLGLCFLLLSIVCHIFIWCLLAFLMVMVIIINNVCIESSRAIAIPEKNRVKVQVMHNACIIIGNPFGLLITPFLITNYGYTAALMVYSLIVILVAIFIRFIPLFNELLSKNQEDIINLYEKNMVIYECIIENITFL